MRSVYVLFFIVLFSAVSQAQSNSDLIGSWLVDFPTTIDNMSVNAKAAYDSLSDRARSNFTNSFETRTFQFKSDSTIAISFQSIGDTKQADGSWLYDPTDRRLSISAGRSSRDFIVQWLGEDSILLIYQNVEGGALLQSLCLNRQ